MKNFSIPLSKLANPTCQEAARTLNNPRREFLKSGQYGPPPLPLAMKNILERSKIRHAPCYSEASKKLAQEKLYPLHFSITNTKTFSHTDRDMLAFRALLLKKNGSYALTNTHLLPAVSQPTEEHTNCNTVSIKVVGDIGYPCEQQTRVAEAIAQSVENSKDHEQHPTVMVVGDWVYSDDPGDAPLDTLKSTQDKALSSYKIGRAHV